MSLRLGGGVKPGPLSSPREHGPDLSVAVPTVPRGRGHLFFSKEIGGYSQLWVAKGAPPIPPVPNR